MTAFPPPPRHFRLALAGDRALALEAGRPRLMGIVNVTPDSFSDGGRFASAERAIAHALELVAEGAEIVDVGGESSRPGGGVYGTGARDVSPTEELDRVLPVVAGLRRASAVTISIDTRKAEVARAALAAGADLVNDVSALADPAMVEVVRDARCPVVLMHARGELATMQAGIHFGDVVAEVAADLFARVAAAEAMGLDRARIVVDPGIGFGKTARQSLALLAGVDRLRALDLPVLVGASRKSFIGAVTGAAVERRLPGSLAAALRAAAGGAAILRVHDVAATRQCLDLWSAIDEALADEGVA